MAENLPNKPLVEALFEIRWDLSLDKRTGFLVDPYYKVLVGQLADALNETYPNSEDLTDITMPEIAMSPYKARYMFRVSEGAWPVVQLGHGVLTLNDTSGYKWDDFKKRCLEIIEKFIEVHPDNDSLKFSGIYLVYIDAEPFNFHDESTFVFLRDKLHIDVQLPDKFCEHLGKPLLVENLLWNVAFPSKDPKGTLGLELSLLDKDRDPIILWNTWLRSEGEDIPQIPDQCDEWLERAHELLKNIFLAMIEGDLHAKYSAED